jgi:hypothetical protein
MQQLTLVKTEWTPDNHPDTGRQASPSSGPSHREAYRPTIQLLFRWYHQQRIHSKCWQMQ